MLYIMPIMTSPSYTLTSDNIKARLGARLSLRRWRLGTRAIAVFLFAGCGPDFGKIRRPAPGVRFGPITSFRDQNQGETHATQDGTVEPSDDQHEQFLELESMRKRPCSRRCHGSFRNSR